MAEEGLEITFFVLLSVCTVHNITLFDHYSFFLYDVAVLFGDIVVTHTPSVLVSLPGPCARPSRGD